MVRKSVLLIFLAGIAYCDTGFQTTIQVTETDNSPRCQTGQIKFSAGTVTCSGNVATVTSGAGGGGGTLPLLEGSTNYVQVGRPLQTGAFNISSGTATNFISSSITIPSGYLSDSLSLFPANQTLGVTYTNFWQHAQLNSSLGYATGGGYYITASSGTTFDPGAFGGSMRFSTVSSAFGYGGYTGPTVGLVVSAGGSTIVGPLTVDGAGGLDVDFGVVAATVTVNDDAYAAGWNGSLLVPTKNAVYDKIEAISVGGGTPGAPVNSVQFNSAGAFGGNANFNFSGTSVSVLGAPMYISSAAFIGDSVGGVNLAVKGGVLFSHDGSYGGTSSATVAIYTQTPAGTGTRLFTIGTDQQLNQVVFADRIPPVFGTGLTAGSLTIGSSGNTQAIRTDQNTNKMEVWRTGTGGDMVLFTSSSDDGSIKFEVAGTETASFDNNGITFISSVTVTKNVNISSNTVLNGTTFYHGGNAVISQPGKQAKFAGDIVVSSGLVLGTSAGTNGQVLTSGGSDTTPSWTTPSAGGGGGGSTLAVSTASTTGYHSPAISSPTHVIGFRQEQFTVSLLGNATAFVQVNLSSITARGQDPTVAGDVTGTLSAIAVTDDSHAHTGTTLSGIDISGDTNLTASGAAVLAGDNIGVGTIDISTGTNLTASGQAVLSGDNVGVGPTSLSTGTIGQIGDAQIEDGAVDGGSGGEIADGTVDANDLGVDSVSSSELNATGVESELEAVLDLPQLQGTLDISGQSNLTASGAAVLAGDNVGVGRIDISTGTNLTAAGSAVLNGDILGVGTIDVSTGTNLTAAGAAVLNGDILGVGTIDISTGTNLTAGTNITLTGDDLSVDDSFILNTGDIGTGVYDFGGATALELPNGTAPTVDTTGEYAQDTTDNALIAFDGISNQVIAHSTHSFTVMISSSGWNGHSMVVWRAPHDMAVTINKIMAESLTAGTTVRFQLDEVTFGGTGSAGTDVFSVQNSSAHNQGVTTIGFANAGIAAQSSLVFNTPAAGAAGGSPLGLTFTVYYVKNRE